MIVRRLIPSVVTLALVFGAAGAITHAARFAAKAPAATAEAPRSKGGPVYNGKSLQRAINVLQGAAGLVGRDKSEAIRQEPTPDRKPATRNVRPDADRVPDNATTPTPAPAPVIQAPPVRQERPERDPASRAKEPPRAEKPVIVRNDRSGLSRAA